MCQIHVYANPHSLYHQYSLLSSGVEGFDEHANKNELKTLLSLHVCVNIHIDLALLKKEIYSTRCCSDNSQVVLFSLHGATFPNRSRAPNYRGFKITFRHTTLGISSKHRHLPESTQRSKETGSQIHNPSKRADADPRLRPRKHWDRPSYVVYLLEMWRLYSANMAVCVEEVRLWNEVNIAL